MFGEDFGIRLNFLSKAIEVRVRVRDRVCSSIAFDRKFSRIPNSSQYILPKSIVGGDYERTVAQSARQDSTGTITN